MQIRSLFSYWFWTIKSEKRRCRNALQIRSLFSYGFWTIKSEKRRCSNALQIRSLVIHDLVNKKRRKEV